MADRVIQRGKSMTQPSGVKTTGQTTNFKGPVYREQDNYPKNRSGSNPNPGKGNVTG